MEEPFDWKKALLIVSATLGIVLILYFAFPSKITESNPMSKYRCDLLGGNLNGDDCILSSSNLIQNCEKCGNCSGGFCLDRTCYSLPNSLNKTCFSSCLIEEDGKMDLPVDIRTCIETTFCTVKCNELQLTRYDFELLSTKFDHCTGCGNCGEGFCYNHTCYYNPPEANISCISDCLSKSPNITCEAKTWCVLGCVPK